MRPPNNTRKLSACESRNNGKCKRAYDEEGGNAYQSVASRMRSAVNTNEVPYVSSCPHTHKKPALPANRPLAPPSQYSLEPRFFHSLSGCRESNSGYKHPMLAYYHYTTSRIGPPGILSTLAAPSRGSVSSRGSRPRLLTRHRSALRFRMNSTPVLFSSLSGRRESNPVFTHPKRTYYRYTTARLRYPSNKSVVTHSFLLKTCATPARPAGLRLAQPALRSVVHPSGFEPETFRM